MVRNGYVVVMTQPQRASTPIADNGQLQPVQVRIVDQLQFVVGCVGQRGNRGFAGQPAQGGAIELALDIAGMNQIDLQRTNEPEQPAKPRRASKSSFTDRGMHGDTGRLNLRCK